MYIGQECYIEKGRVTGVKKQIIPKVLDFKKDNDSFIDATSAIFGNHPILLKSLASVSHADIIEVCKIEYGEQYGLLDDTLLIGDRIIQAMEFGFKSFQYLQSKGYALPYLDYSVEQLVKLKVYKLIKQ
jgi:hypothetical protein